MKSKLLKLYYKTLEVRDKIVKQYNKKITIRRKKPIVKDTDKTLEKLIKEQVSMSRYGDGEFGLIQGKSLLFQPYSKEIELRLKEILISNNESHIICIPDIFNDLDKFIDKAKYYWENYLNLNRASIYRLINRNKKYYDALVTRLYIDYIDKSNTLERFIKIKKIWKDKEIVIVEGEKSRLGVGNDLFNKSKSIERIICPSIDAYSKYNTILEEVLKIKNSKLILIALGPTATILAYDLSQRGYRAIDIGHIDIEYEWFLSGAIEKVPVKNKYIGEINRGTKVDSINNIKYEQEIICRI